MRADFRDPLKIMLSEEADVVRKIMGCMACLGRPKEVCGEAWCRSPGSPARGCGYRLDETVVERK